MREFAKERETGREEESVLFSPGRYVFSPCHRRALL